MFAFVLRRIGQSLFVMLVVAIIAFSMFRFVGDPVHNMVGQQTSMEDREKLREALGLNDPFYVQFYKFIKNAVKGDFGVSYRHGRP
ncbi:MAG: ABC transporter permease, partial [Alphaproteobacteria bacterium]|nr:ABC transporter permease [Alphaproteobacteria bacterium]